MTGAIAVECRKAFAQWHYRLMVIVCVIAPFVFVLALRAQSTIPSDTLFGRLAAESGLATPLIVLGFAGLWGLPVIAAAAGGDMFASEDRHRTWVSVLTRSRSRSEIFAAKTIVASGFAIFLVLLLAASSLVAGVVAVGTQPLIDLSGALREPADAIGGIALAWLSVLPPCVAITAAASFVSVSTRSSVAGVGIPVFASLVLQLASLADGPPVLRAVVPTTAFDAWHGLVVEHGFYAPLVYGTTVNVVLAAVFIVLARRIFLGRDIA